MINDDAKYWQSFLLYFALKRLISDARHGRAIARYLPTRNFASVRVIRSEGTSEILARLIAEDGSFAQKIFVGEKDDWPVLIRDMTPENLPHLLLTLYDDDELLELLAKRGFVYGKHIVSFRREYADRCAQIIGKFGRRNS